MDEGEHNAGEIYNLELYLACRNALESMLFAPLGFIFAIQARSPFIRLSPLLAFFAPKQSLLLQYHCTRTSPRRTASGHSCEFERDFPPSFAREPYRIFLRLVAFFPRSAYDFKMLFPRTKRI